jgi:hypothetical protein
MPPSGKVQVSKMPGSISALRRIPLAASKLRSRIFLLGLKAAWSKMGVWMYLAGIGQDLFSKGFTNFTHSVAQGWCRERAG